MSTQDSCATHGPQDAAQVTAGVILQIIRSGLTEWFYRKPIDADELRRRVADAIRDHDRGREADLYRDWPPAD
jgi:hypothetical protein